MNRNFTPVFWELNRKEIKERKENCFMEPLFFSFPTGIKKNDFWLIRSPKLYTHFKKLNVCLPANYLSTRNESAKT